jgi:hypothetical protein
LTVGRVIGKWAPTPMETAVQSGRLSRMPMGRMRTRLEVSRARGFSKFVGRQSEMAALEAALETRIGGRRRVP